jgi:hypothetical protein
MQGVPVVSSAKKTIRHYITYFKAIIFQTRCKNARYFSGIAVAWSGGFIMLWLYAQTWMPESEEAQSNKS